MTPVSGPWIGAMTPIQDFGEGFAATFELAEESERLGLDSVWIGDHLAFRHPVVESIVTAAMLAARTTTVKLGFGILQIAMRHPVWLAKQLSTLAHLSGGRVEIGVGIGGENPEEWIASGVPSAQRVSRTVELLGVLPLLLRGQAVHHAGHYYSFEAPPLLPTSSVPPPLWMGGRSDGALQRAATLADGWLGLWVDEPRLRRSVELMAELADAECRPPPPAALVIPVAVTPDKRVADERLRRFVTMQYGGDLERFARWCIHGSPARIAEHLAAYVAAGASGFVLMPTAANPVDEIEGIAEIRTLLHG